VPALLSCSAPGRPPHLEGEAARPSLATNRKAGARLTSQNSVMAKFAERPYYALG
jgi:hypothetical protein